MTTISPVGFANLEGLSNEILEVIYQDLSHHDKHEMRRVSKRFKDFFVTYHRCPNRERIVKAPRHPFYSNSISDRGLILQPWIIIACTVSSIWQGTAFHLGKLVSFFFPMNFVLGTYFYLTTTCVYSINLNPNLAGWVTTITGIAVSTLLAETFYLNFWPSDSLSCGFVFGIYSYAMMFFACADGNVGFLGFHSLRLELQSLMIQDPFSRYPQFSRHDFEVITRKSDQISTAAFLVSSVFTACISQNPILTNLISYPLCSLVKVASMRLLADRRHARLLRA